MKDVSDLILNISGMIEPIRHDRKTSKLIKDDLAQYNISGGDVQRYINFPSELSKADIRETCLFADTLFKVTKNPHIDPLDYFTERQIKEVKTTYIAEIKERAVLPYKFSPVIKVNDDLFFVKTSAQETKFLYDSGLIFYNPEYQREPKLVKNKLTNEIIPEPKVNEGSVDEIDSLLEKNKLISSVLMYNARLGSSDEGEELLYDEKNMELIVTEGTYLDSLDGFHRIKGIVRALDRDPSLNVNFGLYISNYSIPKAKAFFKQLNTTNPISKSRLKEEDHDSLSSFVVNELQYKSELSEKISNSDEGVKFEMLTTFSTLSDSVQRVYSPSNKIEAIKLVEYLTEFFNSLMYAFPEEFIISIEVTRKNSLINNTAMFAGYVALAKKMQDNKVPLTSLKEILNTIDFSRESKQWIKRGILNQNGHITGNSRLKAIEFFNKLDISNFYKVVAENV